MVKALDYEIVVSEFELQSSYYVNFRVNTHKYLNLAREFKKLWNMKVKIMPIVIAAFGTITNNY